MVAFISSCILPEQHDTLFGWQVAVPSPRDLISGEAPRQFKDQLVVPPYSF